MPKCVSRCYKHSDCKEKGFFCQDGHCRNSCKQTSDCPVKENRKELCKQGLCYYIKTGCDVNEECPKGSTCYKRRCIKSQCGSDAECNSDAFSCVKGSCVQTEKCKSNTDCQTKYGRAFSCIHNTCKKVTKKS